MDDAVKTEKAFRKTLKRSSLKRWMALSRGYLSVLATSAAFLFMTLTSLNSFIHEWRFFSVLAFSVFWAGMAAGLVAAFLPRSSRPMRYGALAIHIDGINGPGRSLIRSAYDFTYGNRINTHYSKALITRTIKNAEAEMNRMQAGGLFLEEGRPLWGAAGFLIGILFLFQSALYPEGVREAAGAILDPGESLREARGANLVVLSGNISLIEGEDALLEGLSFGSRNPDVYLGTSFVDGVWNEVRLEPDTSMADGRPVIRFRKWIDHPRNGFLYRFRSGEHVTETFTVEMALFPVINRLGARLAYPPYTGVKEDTVKTVAGKVNVLRGTEIVLEGLASKDIEKGVVVFESGLELPLKAHGKRFEASFRAVRDDTFSVFVSDSSGLRSRKRISYPIAVKEDRPPDVEVVFPKDGEYLPRSLLVDIGYRAADDYRVAGLGLYFKKDERDRDFKRLRLPVGEEENRTSIENVFEWSLSGFGVMPGDRIAYYLEAYDNNSMSGPGYARTPLRSLKVPSMSELYARQRKREELRKRDIGELYEKGREIREDLKNISERLKAEGEMDWSKRRKAGKVLRGYEELRDKAQKTADALDETLDDIERNMMTSMEIGKKLELIREMVSDLKAGVLDEIIEKMRKILQEMPEEEISSAMDELDMTTREMLDELDRTIDFLNQVMREEKMEEMMRRMEALLNEQSALRDSSLEGDLKSLAGEQRELGKEAEELEGDMGEFAARERENIEGLSEIGERLSGSAVDSLMNSSAGHMENGERDSATCAQSAAIDGLLSLYTCMGRCQAGMNMVLDRETVEAVNRAVEELVEASRVQEEVALYLEKGRPYYSADTEAKQIYARSAAGKILRDLYDIARRAMFGSRKAFMKLGAALNDMDMTLTGIEKRRGSDAFRASVSALENMNGAAVELLKSTSSSGGGGKGAQRRMKTMLDQQMTIDGEMRGAMSGGNRAGTSMSERAEMARIAAKQRKIEELMKQIEEESGRTGDLLGNIEGMASEMDTVASKLERGLLDRTLLDREEKILSRMLQAQRSINRRDYKRERVSAPGETVWGQDEGRGIAGPGEREVMLEMIRRAMREKGPAEYEELIRLYFRALSDEVRKSGRNH